MTVLRRLTQLRGNAGWTPRVAVRLRTVKHGNNRNEKDATLHTERPLMYPHAYVVAAKLGFRVAFVAEQVTTVWPPTGLAEAALLLWGRSLWPAIWLGAFITNATPRTQRGRRHDPVVPAYSPRSLRSQREIRCDLRERLLAAQNLRRIDVNGPKNRGDSGEHRCKGQCDQRHQ